MTRILLCVLKLVEIGCMVQSSARGVRGGIQPNDGTLRTVGN